ncbi:hypothetical protein BGZ65_000494, partial [Modicella reniformis]
PFVDQDPSIDNVPGKHLPKRTQATIEHNEYCILAHLFTKLSEAPSEVQDWLNGLGMRSRDKLKALTGVNVTACNVAIKFANTGVLSAENTGRGRKKKPVDSKVSSTIRTIVLESNKQ